MPTHLLLGRSEAQEALDALRQLTALELLLIDLASDADPSEWVYNSASALIAHLREAATDGTLDAVRHLVVAIFPTTLTEEQTVQRAAVVQALRGVVQSVTREYAHHLSPLNLVAIDDDEIAGLAPTLEYLDAPDGGYVAGFTFDLTQETVR